MSTDLTASQWREIERQAVDIVRGQRHIGLGALRTILKKSRRSTSQNATLWMIYGQILERGGEELGGFSRDDLHEFFLIDHFGGEAKALFGRKRIKPHRRSSQLTKSEFTDYLDHVVRFAAERGIVVDMPGDPNG